MKKKIINTLKSVGLILLILTFTSFMFVLLNIDVNSISDVKYLFYLSIFFDFRTGSLPATSDCFLNFAMK